LDTLLRANPADMYVGSGTVVPLRDSLVFAMTCSVSERDMRPSLHIELETMTRIAPARAGDRIGAMSFVLGIEPINDDFEEIRVLTLGIKNLDVADSLKGVAVPKALLVGEPQTVDYYDQVCERALPILKNRIVTQIVRRIVRPRHVGA